MTTSWRWGVAAGVIAGALLLGLASCGDDNETTTAPPALSEDPLHLEIQSAVVPDFATTALPTVRFRVTDGSGAPIDLEAELVATTAPNTSGPRFTLAMLDDNGDYVSYFATTVQPKLRADLTADYTYIPDPEILGTTATEASVKAKFPPAARTQAQAPTFNKANLKKVSDGVYDYTFPARTVTSGLDRTKTHTVAGWMTRKPNAADTDVAFGSFNFVPSGGAAVQKLETVTDAACSKCHGFVQAHGTRRGVQLCITCHSPQTGDPETNQTVNFKVMIHKIHSGGDLPSVHQKTPYFIVGNSQSVHDWSDLSFPWHDHGVRHCTVCHDGEDRDNWKSKPTQTVCTSCHDNVKFDGGTACPTAGTTPTATLGFFADCLHAPGPISVTNPNDVASCIGCHGPGAAQAVDKYHHGD